MQKIRLHQYENQLMQCTNIYTNNFSQWTNATQPISQKGEPKYN